MHSSNTSEFMAMVDELAVELGVGSPRTFRSASSQLTPIKREGGYATGAPGITSV
jgi:hypothetical protein